MPTHWEELTLAQCAWLCGRVKEISQDLRGYYLSYVSKEGPKELEDTCELLAFAREVIARLSSVPEWALRRVEVEDVLRIAVAVLPRFVCGVMGYVDYAASQGRGFRYRCRRYLYPQSGADISGVSTPLSGLSAIELCQVSDIVMSGNLTLAPLAVAICCRPPGEQYDEGKALKRAPRFAALSMSVYWELWLRVSEAHGYLRGSFPACYGKEEATAEKGGGKAALWSDMMVAMAVGNPSALADLQRMNGYDFVHLMSESLKQKTEQWKMNAALSGLGAR